MRILSGVIYWISVGVLTSVGVYASVFGNLFPYFLLAALVMVVLGAWRPGARYSWGALVGFGGLPALVFLANIIEGIRSALNPYCNPDPGTGEIAHPPEAGVVECSFVPGSYYVLFAIFTAITALRPRRRLTLPRCRTILPHQPNCWNHNGKLSYDRRAEPTGNRLATPTGTSQTPKLIALDPAVQFNRTYPPCCRTADKILFVGPTPFNTAEGIAV